MRTKGTIEPPSNPSALLTLSSTLSQMCAVMASKVELRDASSLPVDSACVFCRRRDGSRQGYPSDSELNRSSVQQLSIYFEEICWLFDQTKRRRRRRRDSRTSRLDESLHFALDIIARRTIFVMETENCIDVLVVDDRLIWTCSSKRSFFVSIRSSSILARKQTFLLFVSTR